MFIDHKSFNDFDCGYDFEKQCNMFQFLYGGWVGGIAIIYAVLSFVVGLLMSYYIASLIHFHKRNKKIFTIMVILGIFLVIVGVIEKLY